MSEPITPWNHTYDAQPLKLTDEQKAKLDKFLDFDNPPEMCFQRLLSEVGKILDLNNAPKPTSGGDEKGGE